MKCDQCTRPALYMIGNEGEIPLCLNCFSTWSYHQNIEFLKNAIMMNNAMDQMDLATGVPSPGGRMPVQMLARAIQRSTTLNNISINQAQIGILNTGAIQRIDAAITLTKGTDAQNVGELINQFAQAVLQSEELGEAQKNEIVDLTETLAEEVVGKRKPATITAIMKSISEKVNGLSGLVVASTRLWDAIKPLLPV